MLAFLILVSQPWPPDWWPMYGGGLDYGNTHFSPTIGLMAVTPDSVKEHPMSIAVEAAPACVNLDGDSALEIVAAGSAGRVDAWDPVSDLTQWSVSLTGASFYRATGTMADVDGDGVQEIILVDGGTAGGTYCLNAQTGATEWTYPGAYGNTSAKVIDIDGDGDLDIIVGSQDGYVYCLNGTGGLVWSRSIGVGSRADMPVAISDLDGDGKLEIVAASIMGTTALNHDGAVLWTNTSGPGRSAPTIIPDVNSDGHPDVVHHGTFGGVYCYSGLNGNQIWSNLSVGDPGDTPLGFAWSGTAASDLDGDGTWEVVTGQVDTPGYLWCLNASTGATEWVQATETAGLHAAVALADLDGDGLLEIVAGGYRNLVRNMLRVYNHDGTLLWEINFDDAHDMHDPVVADVDADGCAEIVVGIYDDQTGHNSVFVLDDGIATDCGILGQWEEHDPFPDARIRFFNEALEVVLPRDGQTRVSIYDATGRLVKNLVDAPMKAGVYTFGVPGLSRGVYNAVLVEPGGSRSAKMLIR
jgi:outer membrane protein assembly factor BamB